MWASTPSGAESAREGDEERGRGSSPAARVGSQGPSIDEPSSSLPLHNKTNRPPPAMSNSFDAEKGHKKRYDDDTVAYTEEASVVGIAERKLGVSRLHAGRRAGALRGEGTAAGPVACSARRSLTPLVCGLATVETSDCAAADGVCRAG